MSAVNAILEHLDGVRQTRPSRWIARCPAHEDRSPSLSISEVDDRVLLHDFGGCATSAVLAALGLSLSDLFEKPLASYVRTASPRIPATDVLIALDHELTVAVLLLQDAAGRTLDAQEQARFALSVSRIKSGLNYARGLK